MPVCITHFEFHASVSHNFKIMWSAKEIVSFVIFAVCFESLLHIVGKRLLGQNEEIEDEDESATAEERGTEGSRIVILQGSEDCIEHKITRQPCNNKVCPYRHIMAVVAIITEAESYIDLFLMHLALEDVAYALVDAKLRGVRVRIITEMNFIEESGSQMKYLESEGIEVRMLDTVGAMHMKLAVIDNRIVIGGSVNWTFQGFMQNNDTLHFLYDEQAAGTVEAFYNEFWEEVGLKLQ